MEGTILVIIGLFGFIKTFGGARESCDRHAPRLFSTRTAYDEARHKEVKVEEIQGCRVKAFYSLNRHGTRYPGADEIQDMADILPSVRDKIVNKYKKGSLCANHVAALRQWKLAFDKELGLENTPIGLQEMEDLGERWRSRFPAFFASLTNKSVDIRCGGLTRIRQSSEHFQRGLSPGGELSGDCNAVKQEKDNLLYYLDNCAHYIAARIAQNDPEKYHSTEYDQSPLVKNMLNRINKRLGLEHGTVNFKIASVMHEACRFEHAAYRYAPWCEVFEPEDVEVLVYRHDMKYYWRYGHGRTINYLPSCLLLEDIISTIRISMQSDIHERHLTMRMGSSRSILPLLVRFGLFRDTAHLHTNNSHTHKHRQWQLGQINPFASNFVLVLYNCDNGPKIRTFLNERIINIGNCDTDWCPVDVFLEQWSKIVMQCDYKKICDNSSLKLSDYRYDMHHL